MMETVLIFFSAAISALIKPKITGAGRVEIQL
jgi:hypothetical protein